MDPILTTITQDKTLDWSVETLGHERYSNFLKQEQRQTMSNK